MPNDNITNITSDKKKGAHYDDETPPISSQDSLKTIKSKAEDSVDADAQQHDG